MTLGTYWYIDLWRGIVAVVALWMATLVLRLAYRRWQDQRRGLTDRRTDPFVYLSYAIALISFALFRIDRFGHPLDARLPAATLVVVTGFIGLMRRVRFSAHPPHRRHDDDGEGAR